MWGAFSPASVPMILTWFGVLTIRHTSHLCLVGFIVDDAGQSICHGMANAGFVSIPVDNSDALLEGSYATDVSASNLC
jgi:hypothetical protein